jgi:alkanesulfonate monooxygenase SsuD/methylene tetrahydromethanopterin reductase-like flavin-dependent oxidoreductase (luciferase family)
MKVGLFINTQFPEGYDVAARVPEMVEQVRVARDAGFKSLWFPHHWLTYPRCRCCRSRLSWRISRRTLRA